MRRCSRNSRDLGVVIGAASCTSVLHTLGYWAQKKKPAISPLSSRAPPPVLRSIVLDLFNADDVVIVPHCVINEGMRVLGQDGPPRSEEHTSELQSRQYLVC